MENKTNLWRIRRKILGKFEEMSFKINRRSEEICECKDDRNLAKRS
jgi:hypothetical protein